MKREKALKGGKGREYIWGLVSAIKDSYPPKADSGSTPDLATRSLQT